MTLTKSLSAFQFSVSLGLIISLNEVCEVLEDFDSGNNSVYILQIDEIVFRRA